MVKESRHAHASASRLGWLALFPLATFATVLAAFLGDVLPADGVRWSWVPSLGVKLAFRFDGLSVLFLLLISGVGTLVFVYASGYLSGHPRRRRLFLLLSVFVVAMVGCVTADDLIALFVCWELTSLSSFLLVGFEHASASGRSAARQALLVTAAGGLVLLAGILLLGQAAQTYSIQELLVSAPTWREEPLVEIGLICVFIGAFTKSAQFPFHFWLPNAMAAPTPVSAYLHSATMVKLGVYLLARLHPAFCSSGLWQITLVVVGGVTSIGAMLLALLRQVSGLVRSQRDAGATRARARAAPG
ncbi:MAG: hypothetical protein JW751_14345, partial [Polyangiaceae bacterium]|nr:hypothetical protein [Polyangiaceae bacterium]